MFRNYGSQYSQDPEPKTKFAVGDKVDFKQDIEGHGTVLEVISRQTFSGTGYTYIIGSSEPGPWHVTSFYNDKHGRHVVAIDDGYRMYHSEW